MQRYKVRETDDYTFEVDDHGSGLVVHAEIRHYSPAVLRQCEREWKLFRSIVTAPLFAIGPSTEDAKWRRFITRFGFKPHGTVLCNNGAERSVYIHTVP